METKNIMIVGVGGQGSLLASKLLGRLLLTKGYDIKVSEVHGMSQRGGSVVTYVRFGEKVYSPVIDKGEADFIVSFELLEAARWTEFLKPGGKLIANTQQINPMPVIIGTAEYPKDLADKIPGAIYCETLPEVTEYLKGIVREGDMVITMGAGDIYRAGEALLGM